MYNSLLLTLYLHITDLRTTESVGTFTPSYLECARIVASDEIQIR